MCSPADSIASRNGTKGQLWTSDMLMATMLLVLVIILFFVVWDHLAFRHNQRFHYLRLWSRANDLAEQLVSASGYPPSWERYPEGQEASVQEIGLAYSPNHISSMKLRRIEQWNLTNYTGLREKLGVAPYDIYGVIFDPAENTTLSAWGVLPPDNATQIRLTRFVLVNGTAVQLTVNLWEN